METTLQRIDERLKAIGMSGEQMLKRAGLSHGMLSRARNARREISLSSLRRMAPVLKCSVACLMGEEDFAPIDHESSTAVPLGNFQIPVVGKVEAGRFFLVDELAGEEPTALVFGDRHPLFPYARHMAFDVVGDSMNDLKPIPIYQGERVIAVDWMATGYAPRTDDIVVVERTRDGGHLRELTLKQVEVRPDGIALCPRSTNKAHKEIWVPRGDFDDGQTVRMIGLVYSKQSFFQGRY
jgi:transcriptional regulator with XRE-family HTH domain